MARHCQRLSNPSSPLQQVSSQQEEPPRRVSKKPSNFGWQNQNDTHNGRKSRKNHFKTGKKLMGTPSPNNWRHKPAKLPPCIAGSNRRQTSGPSNHRPHRSWITNRKKSNTSSKATEVIGSRPDQSQPSLSKPQKQQWIKLSGSLSTQINIANSLQ